MSHLIVTIRTENELGTCDHERTEAILRSALDADPNITNFRIDRAEEAPNASYEWGHPDDFLLIEKGDEPNTYHGPIVDACDAGVKIEDGQVYFVGWTEIATLVR